VINPVKPKQPTVLPGFSLARAWPKKRQGGILHGLGMETDFFPKGSTNLKKEHVD